MYLFSSTAAGFILNEIWVTAGKNYFERNLGDGEKAENEEAALGQCPLSHVTYIRIMMMMI